MAGPCVRDTAMGKQGASFVGGLTFQDYSDRETANGKVVPSAYRAKAADAKVLFDFGSNAELAISAQVLEQPSTPRTDELVPGYGQSEPASEIFQFQPNRRSFLHGRYRRDLGGGWADDMQLSLARQIITDDRITQDYGETLLNTEQNESTLDGLTAQFTSSPSNDWLLTWGAEIYRDEVRSTRQLSNVDGNNSEEVRARFPDRSTMDSDAVYLSASWHAMARLDLDAGLRYSSFDIHLPATMTSPEAKLGPDDFTGDLRLLFSWTETLNLVANIGRGFRPPNVFDLGTLGPRPGDRFNVANTSLSPETVWSYDLGLKIQNSRWEAEAFVFYMDYRDKITSVSTGEVTPDGRTVVRAENRNSVELYGFEFGGRWVASDTLLASLVMNFTYGNEKEPGPWQRSCGPRATIERCAVPGVALDRSLAA